MKRVCRWVFGFTRRTSSIITFLASRLVFVYWVDRHGIIIINLFAARLFGVYTFLSERGEDEQGLGSSQWSFLSRRTLSLLTVVSCKRSGRRVGKTLLWAFDVVQGTNHRPWFRQPPEVRAAFSIACHKRPMLLVRMYFAVVQRTSASLRACDCADAMDNLPFGWHTSRNSLRMSYRRNWKDKICSSNWTLISP